jgi:putative oxidoreductase
VLLGPVVVNIVLFHTLIAHAGFPNAAVAIILWLAVFMENRRAFSGPLLGKRPHAASSF